MIKVKICGITRLQDALMAIKFGAHAVGFIFFKDSKRYIEPDKAKEIILKLPPFVVKVGVFVDEDEERIAEIFSYCNLDRIQLHGDIDMELKKIPSPKIIRAFRIKDSSDIERVAKSKYFPLLDTYSDKLYGGTGERFDWSLLKHLKRDYILAGGINLSNLKEIFNIRPYAIDISSGVEKEPGVKDEKKMFEFFNYLRQNQNNFIQGDFD